MALYRTLCSGFLRSAEAFPDRPAVEVEGKTLTYRELRDEAAAVAATLARRAPSGGPALTAVLARRSVTAFTGVLGALMRGHGYVPLNPAFPPRRNRDLLGQIEPRALVVDSEGEKQLEQVFAGVGYPLLLLLPERREVAGLASRWPDHTFVGGPDLESPKSWKRVSVPREGIAYVLFTSGSTGVPKGVMCSYGNTGAFIGTTLGRHDLTEQDRFAVFAELTFGAAVFDLFVAWGCGACVCCPTLKGVANPGRFILDSRISVVDISPSGGLLMMRFGMLRPNQYPGVHATVFGGEALPAALASVWAKAAPNSIVENTYALTEMAGVCTAYRWDAETSPGECELGMVPIGKPTPGVDAVIVDENLQEVPPGDEGELLLSGPQVSLGYWRDPERTAKAFVVPPGKDGLYYRTGDLVRRRPGGPLLFLGRLDHQIKLHGDRVEPGEVEAALREAAECDQAVAIGWPKTPTGVSGIVAFLGKPDGDVEEIRERLKAKLPRHMVPGEIRFMKDLPLNQNRKVDRGALLKMLEESS